MGGVDREEGLRAVLRHLYSGTGAGPRRFRYGLILFDALTIFYFVATVPIPDAPALDWVNMVLALLILADFMARIWIAPSMGWMLRRLSTLTDAIVVVVLLLDPLLPQSLAFLRLLRALRLIHSFQLMRDLRRESLFFRENEDALVALINLLVFLLMTTSTVHMLFFDQSRGWAGYVDAMYFTVATLTTTGYGDIVPDTTLGKILSIVIMVVGVTLFVQLARALVAPRKVKYTCEGCGLTKHDLDAVHCKHCGADLQIETPGL